MLDLTLKQAAQAIKNGDLTSQDLTISYLAQIKAHNDNLNAYITVDEEGALAAAAAADQASDKSGLLHGLPLGIKDLFCTKGLRTTAASKILGNFIPPYESTVTQNLRDAGAVFLGKLNLDEFAMGSANVTSAYGQVKNPVKADDDADLCRVPGGSSGGSAAAVAAQLCLAATGTDTGGSIRQPASFCGITGLKPTYGRCSRYGIIAFASSLDQAGPMARNVEDCALLLQAMSGHDPKDSTSAKVAVPDFSALLDKGVQGKKIGIPKEYAVEGMPDVIIKAWEDGKQQLTDAGAELVDISLPHTKYALPCYYIIAPAEASSNLARYDGMRYGHRADKADDIIDLYKQSRAQGFGQEVQRRILIGTYVLSAGYYDAYYLKAQQIRTLIYQDFMAAFDKVDVILTPTTPSAAFKLNEKQDDPVAMYLNDVLTVPASMAGLPALSVPSTLQDNGLPLGLQLIGKPFMEDELLQVGNILQQS